jgi:2-keto-4-pentenoate hydratase/2-oxohepta-3-ene-1,7-dioic acid hydratase in catechol pathway
VDELPSGDDLRIQTWVNGELRQDSRTSDQIFDCQTLVDFIAETNTLAPGDLILTGTPSGVGLAFGPPKYLHSGDVIRIAIERLGEIEHVVK